MPTANEIIRDALIRHQIGTIRASGTLSKQIIAELRKSEKEIRQVITDRLADIEERGTDPGPTTTARLLEIERQLRDILGVAHRQIQQSTQSFLEELALREPVFVQNVIEEALPVIVNFGVPPANVLREIVSVSPIDGKILDDWLKKFEADDLDRMMDEIRRGLVQGESVQQIARRIFGTTRLNGRDGSRMISRRGAETLARTLTNGIGNAARQSFFKLNGNLIQAEVYTATLDNRTTPVCASLDGRRFDVGKGPIPPLHPACRSTRVPSIDGNVIGLRPAKSVTRAELDGLDDKARRKRVNELTGQVPASQTYSAFLKNQTVAFQNEVLGVTRARLFRKGELTLDKFVDDSGRLFNLDDLMRREPQAFRNNQAWQMAA